ncbi:hypothetical protein CONCODRAFT_77696 [Conidiobolus coronatus NRRL 28638]|uniref:Transmembrane protein 188 n=1 Tax=Conidiobolus coronatus (strain ATCC 28846 / CBS 209.66 / NRRL 28638) TaxID=796925 RepID=A0A137PC79_CONC2|nr:hypothetical protein CONCODRAFT_77696 [Conidiobolus coronatus NRRL 28638]|eukprot:KXN72609.1 hypothetical protein CONCODRAFT_77696 [Conidiobolus coronatus NRRL 28638]
MEVPSNENANNTESNKLDANTTSPTSETLTKSEKSSDILIMEERLKYNWKLSKYRQRQILLLLGILTLLISYFASNLLIRKQQDSFWKTINNITLLLLIAVFIYICNNGDLFEPQKFVPQTNRTLSKFGLIFDSNTKTISISNQPQNPSNPSIVPPIYLPNPIDREKFIKGLKDFRNQHHQKLTYNPSSSSSSRTRKDSSATKKDKGSTRQAVSPTTGISSEK